jgi:MYXO-CTERM domain-containing protein
MYPGTSPGDVAKRTLDADDEAGVCAAYPKDDGGGGCGCGAGGAPGAGAVLLALLALRRRGRRSAPHATSTPA